MTGAAVTTSVVVVCHRPGPWLEPALASVAGQADEVVVVDNGSPGTEVAEAARRHGARLERSDRNLGFAPGVNRGVAVARGDVVALLNDDAQAGPGWLAAAARVLVDEEVAAVSPKLRFASTFAEVVVDDPARRYPPDPRPLGRCLYSATVAGTDVLAGLRGPGVHRLEEGVQQGEHRRWRWTTGPLPIHVPLDGGDPHDLASAIVLDGDPVPAARVVRIVNNAGSYLSAEGHGGDYGFGAVDDGRFDGAAERFAACGAAMAFRASTWRAVGPFAARFFCYYEDTDWCWRARLAGYRIAYDGSAVVDHVGGATSGGPERPEVVLMAQRNRMDTLTRNAPLAVVVAQARRLREPHQPPGLARAVAPRLPVALAERARLARHRKVRPVDVWRRWAGRDETWD
ncbi:MAG TPA: glycosyltransferase family 2 protein [Acidimicrobiales bacterium]|nr:glycosyltransferase family 2 protein [Acidimicrobiales bacterium]